MGRNKQPRHKQESFNQQVEASKQVKSGPILSGKQVRVSGASSDTLTPMWSFKWVDIGSPWCWNKMTDDEAITVYARMSAFETMTWVQIQQARRGHGCDKDDPRLLSDALNRLKTIGKDEFEIFSLRVDGAGRIWGIKQEQVFNILWWDGKHEVWPYEPPNT